MLLRRILFPVFLQMQQWSLWLIGSVLSNLTTGHVSKCFNVCPCLQTLSGLFYVAFRVKSCFLAVWPFSQCWQWLSSASIFTRCFVFVLKWICTFFTEESSSLNNFKPFECSSLYIGKPIVKPHQSLSACAIALSLLSFFPSPPPRLLQ